MESHTDVEERFYLSGTLTAWVRGKVNPYTPLKMIGTGGVLMLAWIMGNMATIIISVVLVIVVAAVIASMERSKKKGKSSCGCGCSGCAMSGTCHPKK